MASLSKFGAFAITDVVYKTVNNQPLKASILIPKTILEKPEGNCPLLVHWHGGGFVLGERNYEPWFATWLVQLAEENGAVIINPDYRLLPEVKGVDMLDDIKDFWAWVRTSLSQEVVKISKDLKVNLSKVAVVGESAGGYLAIQSAFVCPEIDIKLVISQYGCVDLKIPHFLDPAEAIIRGEPSVPSEASDNVIKKYLKNMKPGTFRTSEEPGPSPAGRLLYALLQQRRLLEFVGPEKSMCPMELLEDTTKFPPIWMIHGIDDTTVAKESTTNFYYKLRELCPDVPTLLTLEPGEHSFDADVTSDETWVKESWKFVANHWA